ncbi:MAG TPA: hypothetical protein VK550_03290 [Polyangiaceae bacterium]|nr:hypothetical protein [Polyangiaceae bacterium]
MPLVTLALALSACARTPPPGPKIPVQAPIQEDASTIDGLVRAYYEVVNVAPREPRQWGRDRTLYSPWIRFVALGESPSDRAKVQVWTHDELVAATEPLIEKGFREREIHRSMRRYGAMAHVDSTYETETGPEHRRSRGLNSLDLYFDGHRWWIASAMWQGEDKEHPLPAELLPPETPPRDRSKPQ